MRVTNRITYRGVRKCPTCGDTRTAAGETPAYRQTAGGTPAYPKVRDQWPFLNEPDCPLELQALVTRRITAYHLYTKLYAQLRDCQDLEQCADVCRRLLDAYLDNQQIFRELEYYRDHHKVLGEHPYFRHFNQVRELRAMSVRELIREEQKTKDNIWRVQSEIRKGDKPHLNEKRRLRLQEYELKLQEIKKLLGEA